MTGYLANLRWQDFIDVLIVSFIIYRIFLLIQGTRARQLIVGLIVVLFMFYLSRRLEFFTLTWLLNNFIASIVVVIVVIFQDDIRRLLLSLGRNPLFRKITYVEETLLFDEIVGACTTMASMNTGALIVLERETGLEEFMEIGVRLDAQTNRDLILSIFQPSSPLHDGAVIIREGRIRAAGCILPLAMKEGIGKDFGTRHRAAIGITEVTDALSIVVSEERGIISYAYRGNIFTGADSATLLTVLQDLSA